MSGNGQPSATARSIALAILATLAACALCLAAYKKLVLDASEARRSRRDKCPCAESEPTPRRAPDSPVQDELRASTICNAMLAARKVKEAGLAPAAPPSSARPADPSSEDGAADDTSAEELRAMNKADMDTLEAQLEEERVDSDWAAATERATARAAELAGSRMQLEEVTCRRTLCRARIVHRETSARDEDLEYLTGVPNFISSMYVYVSPDDERTTLAYFPRQGHSLSVLAPRPPPVPALPVPPPL